MNQQLSGQWCWGLFIYLVVLFCLLYSFIACYICVVSRTPPPRQIHITPGLVGSHCVQIRGLDITYQIGQGRKHTKRREKILRQKPRKVTGNHLALFFPIHDMYGTIGLKDNGVNEAVSQGLVESRSAGNSVRRSRSSSSEILTTIGLHFSGSDMRSTE